MLTTEQILLLENLPNLGTAKVQELVHYLVKRKRNFPSAKMGVIRLIKDVFGPYDLHLKEEPTVELVAEAQRKSQQILELSEKNGIKIVTFLDDAYPEALRNMPDAPLLLHYKGELNVLNAPLIAVTGKNVPSSYTQVVGAEAIDEFVKGGFTIVSGLATGCDALAHTVAARNSTPSVGVLAGGFDTIMHPDKKSLADSVLKNGGVLLSENFFGRKYKKSHAVASCRLQAGLSKGVIVLQTDKEGEPMEAARYAMKQLKPLACLSPSISERSGLDMAHFSGNLKWLELKKTVALNERTSFERFIKQLFPQLSTESAY